jgi:SAM-dependent methyltransferase
MEYQTYWNDEREEKRKAFWLESADDPRLLRHLRDVTNLLRCFEDALAFAETHFQAVHGVVLDLGAGVCWTSAVVSHWPRVEQVHAYDFSEHRLMEIAPLVFQQLDADTSKIERHCTSMYPLPHPTASVDLVIFCQAFYMNGEPGAVMHDVARVLKPGGLLLIGCEGIEKTETWPARWGRRLARAAQHPSLWQRALAGRLSDPSGRYQYYDADYAAFIADAGLRLTRQQLDYPVFRDGAVLATNYFGLKLHA